jgi:hypothetical protein
MDRLQRAVAGWVGPAVYALPIVELWLLSRMGEDGAGAFLVVLQVLWGVCVVVMCGVCVRRVRPSGVQEPAERAEDEPAARLVSDRRLARLVPARRAARPVSSRRRGDH